MTLSKEFQVISFIPLAADEDQFFSLVNTLPLVSGSLITESLLVAHVEFSEPTAPDHLKTLFPNASVTPSDSIIAQARSQTITKNQKEHLD